MEVVLGVDLNIVILNESAHGLLGNSGDPWGSLETDWRVSVDQSRVVASWLEVVESFKKHGFDHWSREFVGKIRDLERSIVIKSLDEINHVGSNFLVSLFLRDFKGQIV